MRKTWFQVLIPLLSVVVAVNCTYAATITVNTEADLNASDSVLSFREAILLATGQLQRPITTAEKNAISGANFLQVTYDSNLWIADPANPNIGAGFNYDFINFEHYISFIQPVTPLPEITGYDTYEGNTYLVLDGSRAGLCPGFQIRQAQVTIRHFTLRNFGQAGILIESPVMSSGSSIERITIEKCGGFGLELHSSDPGTIPVSVSDLICNQNGLGGIWCDGSIKLAVANSMIGTDIYQNPGLGNSGPGILCSHMKEWGIFNSVIGWNQGSGIDITSDSMNGFITGNHIRNNLEYGIKITHHINQTYYTSDAIHDNLLDGVWMDATSYQNQFLSCRFGLDSAGTPAGNGRNGIVIQGAKNLIDNCLAGCNPWNGIVIQGSAAMDNIITRSRVGTDFDTSIARGNGLNGILIDGADRIVIGKPESASWNYIGNNGQDGIRVLNAQRITMQQNSFISNHGLDIDLGGDGRDPIDLLDPDTGPNGRPNAPVITGWTLANNQAHVTGEVRSKPNMNCSVDILAESRTPGNYRRGYIATTTTMTDANGRAVWSADFPYYGSSLSGFAAIMTDANGNTSELSSSYNAASAAWTLLE